MPLLLAPIVCIFRTYLKTCSWKSSMKHVVIKYCVYLDILLMVPIYVIKYTFLRGGTDFRSTNVFKSAAQVWYM